ncbi:hypothetical protein CYL21_3883 [Plasmodium falciparum NF54]|uniref:Uncharacterized protein n=2 Tax=Plasmodium falciparum TaxID=5833 RepID=Q8IJZ1_PLAF7|nr:conserved Plasmodium membrane protein, unknown function [Plasmodium falciparum 3D7]KAF4328141.1 hypothetical protein CYL21_3883 [Plasmodium falciparum NF54]PKC43599.1 hypothetical protein CK202_4825 [Plasmodium falciparum NF54]CZT98295.1 conserved Plasmodium membrane protein, unknown function [Plasmodium falciparum 3D7]|eukprot:XP_001347334.2 conserved Plasmodium membrane protein, unknown function [Plasmodium falciparum 3D7]
MMKYFQKEGLSCLSLTEKRSFLVEKDIKTRKICITKENFKHIFILENVDIIAGLCFMNIFLFICSGLKEDENHGNITTNIHGTLFIISLICYSLEKIIPFSFCSDFLFIFLLSLSCTLPFLSFELKNNYNDCFNTIVFFPLYILLFFTRYHIRLLFVLLIFYILIIFIIDLSINTSIIYSYILMFLFFTLCFNFIFYRYLYYFSRTIYISKSSPNNMLLIFPYINEIQDLSFIKIADILIDLNNYIHMKWMYFSQYLSTINLNNPQHIKNLKITSTRFSNKFYTLKNQDIFKNYPPYFCLKVLYHKKLYFLSSAIDKKKKKWTKIHFNRKKINLYFLLEMINIYNQYDIKNINHIVASQNKKIINKNINMTHQNYGTINENINMTHQNNDTINENMYISSQNYNIKEEEKINRNNDKRTNRISRNDQKNGNLLLNKNNNKKKNTKKEKKIITQSEYDTYHQINSTKIRNEYKQNSIHDELNRNSNKIYIVKDFFSSYNCDPSIKGKTTTNSIKKKKIKKKKIKDNLFKTNPISKNKYETNFESNYVNNLTSYNKNNIEEKKLKIDRLYGNNLTEQITLNVDKYNKKKKIHKVINTQKNNITDKIYTFGNVNGHEKDDNISANKKNKKYITLSKHGLSYNVKENNVKEEFQIDNNQSNKKTNNIKEKYCDINNYYYNYTFKKNYNDTTNIQELQQKSNTKDIFPNITKCKNKKKKEDHIIYSDDYIHNNLYNIQNMMSNKNVLTNRKRTRTITNSDLYTSESSYTQSDEIYGKNIFFINFSCLFYIFMLKIKHLIKYIEEINSVVQCVNFKQGIVPKRSILLSFLDQKTERYYIMWSNSYDLVYYVDNYIYHIILILTFHLFCLFLRIAPIHITQTYFLFKMKSFLIIFMLRFFLSLVIILIFIYPVFRTISINPRNVFIIKMNFFIISIFILFLSIFDYIWTIFIIHKNWWIIQKESLHRLEDVYKNILFSYAQFFVVFPIYYFLTLHRLKNVWYIYIIFIFSIYIIYWHYIGTFLLGLKMNISLVVLLIISILFIIRPFEIVKRDIFLKCVLPYILFLDDILHFLSDEKKLKYLTTNI